MTKTAKFFLALEVFTLILLIILSFFAYPQADDFTFANSLHKFGWLGSQLNWYKTWFGRFSSTMLLVSAGYIDLPVLSKIFPIIIIFGYLFVFYLASGKLFPDVSTKFRLIFALTTMFLFVCGMPSLSQGIYWFCGTATYAVANIAMIIFLSYFDSIKNNKIYIALISLGVFIIGANETAMLLLMICVFTGLLKDIKNTKFWVMFAVFTAFSLIVVLSPGNAVRSEIFAGKSHDFLFSTVASLGLAGTLIGIWLLNPLLWIAAFAFCYFRQKSGLKIVLPEEKPMIVIGFVLFLIFCTLFPSFWATGLPAPERNMNMAHLIFIFLFFYCLNLEKVQKNMLKFLNKKTLLFTVFALWIATAAYFSSLGVPQKQDVSYYLKNPVEAAKYVVASYGQNNFYYVYTDLFSGRVADYKKTMLEREEKIKNYKNGFLCLPKVDKLPKSIVFKDLFEDPEKWENKVFAEYYNLKKVAVCEYSE